MAKGAKKKNKVPVPAPQVAKADEQVPEPATEEVEVPQGQNPRWRLPHLEWAGVSLIMFVVMVSCGASVSQEAGAEIGIGAWALYMALSLFYVCRVPAVSTEEVPVQAEEKPRDVTPPPVTLPRVVSPINIPRLPTSPTHLPTPDPSIASPLTIGTPKEGPVVHTAAATAMVTALEGEVQHLKAQLESQRLSFDGERDEITRDLDARRKALKDGHQKEKEALAARYEQEKVALKEQFDGEKAKLREDRERLEGEVARLKKQLEVEGTEVATPQRELVEMQTLVGELQEQNKALEMQLVNSLEVELGEVDRVRKERDELEVVVEELRRGEARDEALITGLNGEVGVLRGEVDRLKAGLRAEKVGNEEGWKRKQEEVRREHLRMAMVQAEVLEEIAEKLRKNRTRHLSLAELTDGETAVYAQHLSSKRQMATSLTDSLTTSKEIAAALSAFLGMHKMTLDTDNIVTLSTAATTLTDIETALKALHFPEPCDSVRTPNPQQATRPVFVP